MEAGGIFLLIACIFFSFLAALGLRCCAWASSSCSKWGLLFVAVCGLLIAVASCCGARAPVVAARGLSSCSVRALEHAGFSSCGTWAQQLQCTGSVVVAHGLSCPAAMWDLPGPGIEPVSPALAGRFLTTGPPGKSPDCLYFLDEIESKVIR